ncbi:MAG: APC family permease [Candidatus Micrarchaeia archaeon]
MYKLKREVTLRDAVMINLGAIIGAGIFVIIGIAASEAGSSIILSIIISAIIALFTGLSFSEIAVHIAKEGGIYEFAKDAWTPFMGFLGGLLWTTGTAIAIAAVSISLIGYINITLNVTIPQTLSATAVILIFSFINMLGIKNSAKTITIFVIINILVLSVFVVFGSTIFNTANLTNFIPNGINGTLLGAALIFFAFTGFSRITTISDEIKEPKKVIPKAILLSILISAILYILVATVAVGILGSQNLADSTAPLALAISKINNPLLLFFISLGGITATAGVVFTGILGVSRVFFSMARDNELPKKLSFINKFSTPVYAIGLSAIIAILFVFFVSFKSIIESSNTFVLSGYIIINIAALVFWKKQNKNKIKTTYEKIFPIIPVLGILSILMILTYIIEESIIVFLIILVFGVLYYLYKKDAKKSKVPKHSIVREFGKSREEIT